MIRRPPRPTRAVETERNMVNNKFDHPGLDTEAPGLLRLLQTVGSVLLVFLCIAGRILLFTISAISHCFGPPIYFRIIGRMMA